MKKNDVQAILTENSTENLKSAFSACDGKILNKAYEIRIRQNLPLCVRTSQGEFFISPEGNMLDKPDAGFLPNQNHIKAMLDKLTNHSLYAFNSEIKNGYITISGGHRIGISGSVTLEDDRIKTIKHIGGLTIRISREIKGAADAALPHILCDNLHNTMFISPPACGKTTILRDTIRQLSLGGYNKAAVDERSEIGGCYMGIAQNDLGPRTDILEGTPKAAGMMLALRSLSPKIIAVDEIGNNKDVQAINEMAHAGIAVLCTLHGHDIEDLRRRKMLTTLINNKIIRRYIFLSDNPKPGTITGVYNENLLPLPPYDHSGDISPMHS